MDSFSQYNVLDPFGYGVPGDPMEDVLSLQTYNEALADYNYNSSGCDSVGNTASCSTNTCTTVGSTSSCNTISCKHKVEQSPEIGLPGEELVY